MDDTIENTKVDTDLQKKGDEKDNNAIEQTTDKSSYDRSQSLVDTANNTFRELCKTLETEHIKLLELEERRLKLHEDMQNLKMEIEQERNLYKMHLAESLSASNLDVSTTSDTSIESQSSSGTIDNVEDIDEDLLDEELKALSTYDYGHILPEHLETCYEVDENDNDDENTKQNSNDSDKDEGKTKDVQDKKNDKRSSVLNELKSIVLDYPIEDTFKGQEIKDKDVNVKES